MKRPACLCAALAASALLGACADLSPVRAAHVATGYVSHQLCSGVFVAGLEPQRYFDEAIAPIAPALTPLVAHHVDRERREVRATIAGMAESLAVYRPPWGCINATEGEPVALAVPAADAAGGTGSATPAAVAGSAPFPGLDAAPPPPSPALQAALERAFAEDADGPRRHTHAIVVVRHDRIVAERYADGIGIDTPLHGWSATKSVTNALLGILVRKGRLDMHAPAPVAAWSSPADPRHAITPEQLLRMTSGLDAGQSLHDVSAFDPSARMTFAERDMAAFAASRPLAHAPGSHWAYADPNTELLSRIVRDRAGGDPLAVRAFIQRELFDKLGMRHTTFEFDASGTPIGGSHLWAPARAWARFGLLYLHDGVVGGERILPEGWVAESARATPLAAAVGYGAGFWTNRDDGYGARYRIHAGIPADAFMARGSQGQYVLIVPSEDLVIVRLGPAWTRRDDMDTVARLTRDVIAATGGPLAAQPSARVASAVSTAAIRRGMSSGLVR